MPRAPRAYWKGYLRLSLVSIAVEVFNAVESKAEISFRQIHKPSGRRVNMVRTVDGVGKIESADIVKGFEVDQDQYVLLDPEDIDAVRLESKKTIDLAQFVDAAEIDVRYFERPYFMTPADKFAHEGYVVIRNALRKSGKVGLAQATMSGREWLVAVAPLGDGLAMELLRYEEELRDPADFFDEVPALDVDPDMMELALQLIEKKAAPFDPKRFEDRYQTALQALIDEKRKGRPIIAPPEDRAGARGNVIDLMEALKKSVAEGSKKKPKAAEKPAAKPARAGGKKLA